ncbi:rhomboid family intramembrane serine protease [Flavobacterium humi]|uniref:Rhomboid family intramembrane serine protease n=1 Tax=Flavobacterium humi TaxID=2562683 RepID=A0A4Z0L8H7_9FLAO|nr:rhomboid family intramembrane serine protease [Flavobacterium humi]TGD58292.1 rhomboid family intramembrane serine protease [Flavobacterium humi]
MNNMTPTVKQLLIINILFFLGSWAVPEAEHYLALYYFENDNFRFWQPITHMFMHGGIAHLAFNMFALVSFGSILEHFWGWKRFLFFYLSCGIGAFLIHTGVNYYQIHAILDNISGLNLSKEEMITVLNANMGQLFDDNGQMVAGPVKTMLENAHCTQEQFNALTQALPDFLTPALGASGAIYGLLIAFAFMFPDAELSLLFIPIPLKAKYFVPIYMFLYDGFFGIFGSSMFGFSTGVAHFAHIGGALTGLLLMLYWKNSKFNHKRWN